MPTYDTSRFDPPAPIAHVTLRNPRNDTTVSNVVMLIDTGSDASLLPHSAVERLGIAVQRDQRYQVEAFDGRKAYAAWVELELILLRRVFGGHYLLVDGETGGLGRNVLNRVTLLLDGPRQRGAIAP